MEVDAPTLLAYNFAILVKNYFAEFYFRDFNSQIWKKSIKFRDFAFSTSFEVWSFKQFLDKLEQAMWKIFAN